MDSNPKHGKVVCSVGFFSSSFPTECTLSLYLSYNSLLAHKFLCIVTCYRGGKKEESWKNPSRAICEANVDIKALCEQKLGI